MATFVSVVKVTDELLTDAVALDSVYRQAFRDAVERRGGSEAELTRTIIEDRDDKTGLTTVRLFGSATPPQ